MKKNFLNSFVVLVLIFTILLNWNANKVEAGASKTCGACEECSEWDEAPDHHCHKCTNVCPPPASPDWGGGGSSSGPTHDQGAMNAMNGNDNSKDGRDSHGNTQDWYNNPNSCGDYGGPSHGNDAMDAMSCE